MINNIKTTIFLELEMLFAEADVCELTYDTEAHAKAMKKIGEVAKALGLSTVITKLSIDLLEA